MRTSLHCIVGAALLLGSLGAPMRADILYVGNGPSGNQSTILKFTSNGVGSLFADANDGLSGPLLGLAFDSAAYLYVASYGNAKIVKLTPGGIGTVFEQNPTPLINRIGGLAFDSAGNLYVANADGWIEKVKADGVTSVFSPSNGLDGPVGLAFGGMGILYASNQGTDRIVKITSDGVRTFFAGGRSDLAFDMEGNLYVPDGIENNIRKIRPDGSFSIFADTSDGLSFPTNLAFDSAGNLYVSNFSNSTIQKFTPDGVGTVFADASDGLNQPRSLAFTTDAGVPVLPPGGRFVPEPATWADALISKHRTGGFKGDDIFNRTGLHQTVTAPVAAGGTKTFTWKVQNTTSTTASLNVQGTAKSAGFGVQYFDSCGADITTDVVGGTYQISDLPAGSETLFRVRLRVKPSVPSGTVKTLRITVRPADATDSVGTDTVKARATVQ